MNLQPPLLHCHPLPSFDNSRLESIQQAFASAQVCRMQQAWQPQPDSDLNIAEVRAGWQGDSLLVHATLPDRDIYNNTTDLNQETWRLGDVFEIFLRPKPQQSYMEMHVTPHNHRLQLRFPEPVANLGVGKTRPLSDFFLTGPEVMESRTWIFPDQQVWHVYAEIPSHTACEQPCPLPGTEWFFSFSRYDYIHGREKPIYSSTSPHAVLNYHRQEEWGTLRFEQE
ncbi:MAG: carbohydrate-binding family 9-like protein [Verrucomicrobiae bacterium]|nr:carbohydrate-binding family 9-like protein [Verrucomicrobiae bacterium]